MFSKRFAKAKAPVFIFSSLLTILMVASPLAFAATSASVTAPVPGSTLTSTTATFNWTAGTNVVRYRLQAGSAWNNWSYYAATTTSRSATVSNLPSNGSTIYVQLSSLTTRNR